MSIVTAFFHLCFCFVCSTGFLVHLFARKRAISCSAFITRQDQLEDMLIRMTKADEERRKENEELKKEIEEEYRKLRRSLNELIGYYQNNHIADIKSCIEKE
jgi:hypothetical protein